MFYLIVNIARGGGLFSPSHLRNCVPQPIAKDQLPPHVYYVRSRSLQRCRVSHLSEARNQLQVSHLRYCWVQVCSSRKRLLLIHHKVLMNASGGEQSKKLNYLRTLIEPLKCNETLSCSASFWVQVNPSLRVSAQMVASVNDSLIQAVYLWACSAGLATQESCYYE